MKIQQGVVRYKDRNDIVCLYGTTDDGVQYYFLDGADYKKFANGNIIASTLLVEAIDPMVKASHVGLISSDGNIIIPFENKSIKAINDNILLVERATPVSESVIEAEKMRNDPLSATKLVSNTAAVKEQLGQKLGSEGRYVFNDQFSEVTICDINGQNLVNNENYSFVGVTNDKIYMCKNVPGSPIAEYSLFPEAVQNNIMNNEENQINVSDVSISQSVVDNAVNDAINNVSNVSTIPNVSIDDGHYESSISNGQVQNTVDNNATEGYVANSNNELGEQNEVVDANQNVSVDSAVVPPVGVQESLETVPGVSDNVNVVGGDNVLAQAESVSVTPDEISEAVENVSEAGDNVNANVENNTIEQVESSSVPPVETPEPTEDVSEVSNNVNEVVEDNLESGDNLVTSDEISEVLENVKEADDKVIDISDDKVSSDNMIDDSMVNANVVDDSIDNNITDIDDNNIVYNQTNNVVEDSIIDTLVDDSNKKGLSDDVEFNFSVDDNSLEDTNYSVPNSKINSSYDDTSNYYEDYSNYGPSTYGSGSLNGVITTMKELIDLNRKQKNKIVNYERKLAHVSAQSAKMEDAYRNQVSKLKSELMNADSKVKELNSEVVRLKRIINRLQPYMDGQRDLENLVARANDLLSGDNTYNIDDDVSYYRRAA